MNDTYSINELIKQMASIDFFLPLFGIIFAIVYFSLFFKFATASRERRNQKKEKFFACITHALMSESLRTQDDIINLYKGVNSLSSEDLTYKAGLSRWLREYLVELVSNNLKEELDSESIISFKKAISDFIEKNDQTSPFADLPVAERNMISDIAAFLETKDTEAIRRKLGELASSIQARSDDLDKVKNINRWSVPLAVVGLVLTAIFGIISLFK